MKKTIVIYACLVIMSMDIHAHSIKDAFVFEGLMQSRLTYDKIGKDSGKTAINLRCIEFGAQYQVNEWAKINALYIFEDIGKEEELHELEEANILIQNSEVSPVYFQVGKMLLPFGKFDYFTAREPYTIDYAETIKTSLLFGYEKDGLNANIFIFNGSDEKKHGGTSIAYSGSVGTIDIGFHASYIDDIVQVGTTEDSLTQKSINIVSKTAGYTISVHAKNTNMGFIAEYISAMDDIHHFYSKASILNAEMAYDFSYITAAISYVHTKEAQTLDLPKEVKSLTLCKNLFKHTSLFFEYAEIKEYNGIEQDSALVQFALAF